MFKEQEKMAHCQHKRTGAFCNIKESMFEFDSVKDEWLILEWNEPKKAISDEESVAAMDINQMNKVRLIEEGKRLGLKVTPKMTVGKIKEAILDYYQTKEDNAPEI